MADFETICEELADLEEPYKEEEEDEGDLGTFAIEFPQYRVERMIDTLLQGSTASRILEGIEVVRKKRNHKTPYTHLYDLLLPHLNTEWAGKSLSTAKIAYNYSIPDDVAQIINTGLLQLKARTKRTRKRQRTKKKKKKKNKKKRRSSKGKNT